MAIIHTKEVRPGDGHDTLQHEGLVMAIVHTIEVKPGDGHHTH